MSRKPYETSADAIKLEHSRAHCCMVPEWYITADGSPPKSQMCVEYSYILFACVRKFDYVSRKKFP